jgi:hypothetical protein
MRRVMMLAVWLGACLAMVLPRAMGAEAPAQEKPESAVWGELAAMPWEAESVTASDYAELLNRPVDLARRGKPGEKRVYEIRRVNLNLDREGRILNRAVSEGRVVRTLVEEVEPGRWSERFEWERFGQGMGMMPEQYPTAAEVEAARGMAYDYDPRTFDFVNAPMDFASLGNPMTGYMMKVLAMDLHGWDAMVYGLRADVGPKVHIGEGTHWEAEKAPFRIAGVGGPEDFGGYLLGESRIMLAGLTRWQGEPCALVWFAAEGNDVTQDIETPEIELHMKGGEYFRALVAVSLVDGHIVAGELSGPVITRMRMGFGGQEPSELPLAAGVGTVSIREVRPSD